uniref:DNA-directed RNA polymerase n=1 Tax=Oedocladium carolinianum TaxID=55992 RepID=A0A1D8GX91_9CHLO|nr:beta subunit of RNA polymerase [Oedocladium carolinianum]AOT84324.1 beta subunit of RNA polymerase [Oedocladium carolinianum]UCS09768.1 beta subunit of RNA polymerase [Oedocladium carolinianum]
MSIILKQFYKHEQKNQFFSDFTELQRKSFLNLLQNGLIEELSNRNPIRNNKNNIELIFYPEYYKLKRPKWNVRQSILLGKSYVAELYIPVQLMDKKSKKIQLKWVLIGNLPLMTKRGYFIINGAVRVIMNQIIRGPGIYYSEAIHQYDSFDKKNILMNQSFSRYYADFVSLRGYWLRFSVDKDHFFWAEMKKTPKIPLLWFLLGIGLSERVIFRYISNPKRLLQNFNHSLQTDFAVTKKVKKLQLNNYLSNNLVKNQINGNIIKNSKKNDTFEIPSIVLPDSSIMAWDLISKKLVKKKKMSILKSQEQARKWLFQRFMNPRTYDIGMIGRLALNKKLNLSISTKKHVLTSYDLLFATDYLMKVEKGLKNLDDIDHLQNRKLRTAAEIIQIQIGVGLIRLEKYIKDRLNQIKVIPKMESLITTKSLNGALTEFFGTSPLSQFMDQINPLAEITHKRRLTSLGPGGITKDNATMIIRGIHPTHYGRICPVETPEGKNAGLVNSITTYARINSSGLIETPFYKVYKGQVIKNLGIFYLSSDEEEQINMVAADINLSALGFLPKNQIPGRKKDNFIRFFRNQVHYMSLSPIQMISIATSLVPFFEHDDANRALMGANMQRQAVPLIRPKRPIVGTGVEIRSVADSGHILESITGGIVSYVSAQKIIVHTVYK